MNSFSKTCNNFSLRYRSVRYKTDNEPRSSSVSNRLSDENYQFNKSLAKQNFNIKAFHNSSLSSLSGLKKTDNRGFATRKILSSLKNCNENHDFSQISRMKGDLKVLLPKIIENQASSFHLLKPIHEPLDYFSSQAEALMKKLLNDKEQVSQFQQQFKNSHKHWQQQLQKIHKNTQERFRQVREKILADKVQQHQHMMKFKHEISSLKTNFEEFYEINSNIYQKCLTYQDKLFDMRPYQLLIENQLENQNFVENSQIQ